MDIGPGDWVRCISIGDKCGLSKGYQIGGIYQVSDCGNWFGKPWINCVGRVRPEDLGLITPGWSLYAFVPIRPSGEALMRELSKPLEEVYDPDLEGIS